MQIVIDIPKEEYEEIINSEDCGLHILTRAIARGIPLPKRHGRLLIVSEDKIKEEQVNFDFSFQKWIGEFDLSDATVAIIEAD